MGKLSKEDKEDKETEKALKDLAKSTLDAKKRNWDAYKDKYPELYAKEFESDPSKRSKLQKVIDKTQDKINTIKEENIQLKAIVKELKKRYKELYKEVEKRDQEIAKLKGIPYKDDKE